jgi:hypothetical protein
MSWQGKSSCPFVYFKLTNISQPLPCKLVNGVNSTTCVTQTIADEVYRFGNWEYSYIYRDSSTSLEAAVGTFGVWIAELATHIRDLISGKSDVIYLDFSRSSKLMSWCGQEWAPRLFLKYIRRLARPLQLHLSELPHLLLHQTATTIIAYVNLYKNPPRSAPSAQTTLPQRAPAPAPRFHRLCQIAIILPPKSLQLALASSLQQRPQLLLPVR